MSLVFRVSGIPLGASPPPRRSRLLRLCHQAASRLVESSAKDYTEAVAEHIVAVVERNTRRAEASKGRQTAGHSLSTLRRSNSVHQRSALPGLVTNLGLHS